MGRLDVRCNVSIPVTILSSELSGQTETKNIGLKGALLKTSLSVKEKQIIRLRAELPKAGKFESDVRVIRKDRDGIAVRFLDIDKETSRLLWDYIKENLPTTRECPFCGFNNDVTGSTKCTNCGLPVNLVDKDFQEIEDEINQQWVNYIDNATNQFIKQFFEVEELLNEKDIAAETVYARLRRVFNEFIDRAELFETGISNKELIEKCRKRFHQKTNPIFLKSYSFTRTRVWPKGYHGDYKTLEGIYKNTPLSDGIGYYMDLYALNLTLARGVQNRLRILTDILSQELEKRQNPKILNIACGSCRELMELLPLIKNSKARITCIDTDEDALSFAYNRLSSASNITNHIDFRYYNALRFFDYEILERDFSKQDIIYSVGLFDYLQTDTLVKILRNLYNHLNPKGTLIAAFKDVRQYRPQPYHWFMDWTGFLQRKEEDFLEILKEAGIPDGEVRQSRDDTKSIIFYVITRV